MSTETEQQASTCGDEQPGDLSNKAQGSRSPTPPRSQLLELPPELRLIIYEYYLVEEFCIDITASLQAPRLLATCQLVRNEALEIWYRSNTFYIQVDDCDATLLRAFCSRLLEPIKAKDWTPKVRIGTNGRSWPKLMRWARWVFKKEALAVELKDIFWDNLAHEEGVIFAVLNIAKVATTWRQADAMIAGVRLAVHAIDEEWADVDE